MSVAGSASADPPPELVIGVLETPQCSKGPEPAVRPLFRNSAGRWIALDKQEAAAGIVFDEIVWKVTLAGEVLGTVATADPGFSSPHAWTYARDRLLAVRSNLPKAPEDVDLDRFQGWCDPPARRPLVVLSKGMPEDPDKWKPSKPTSGVRERLFEHFARAAGPADTCVGDDSVWTFRAEDLEISFSYTDRTGREIVAVSLDRARNQCDGPPTEAWQTHWFLVDGDVSHLGSRFALVDSGDYDGDGRSELVFWYSGYNRDGYTLVYGGPDQSLDYRWRYH